MGGLNTALLNSANALEVFSRTFNVIGNNIINANTPGYAKQVQTLNPLPFDLANGLSGGVMAGALVSSRSEYLEQAVRTQQQALGDAQQRASDLGQIEPLFSLTSTSGIDSSLNKLFGAFSQLSVNPNDAGSRQALLTQAGSVVQSIHQTAAGINQVSTNISGQTTDVVKHINELASQIASINVRYQANSTASQDAGLDAQMHTALESLSQLTDISVIRGAGGALDVSLGGQVPLVIGGNQLAISSSSASGATTVLDSLGNDVTAHVGQGQLGALVREKNTILPGYITDLNTLAQSVADTVNGQLAQGIDVNGNPGASLFAYNSASDAATSISVNSLTTDQLAAASVGAPGGNGNAIALTQLGTAPTVNGATFTGFYGNLGSRVGNDVASATQDTNLAQGQLSQAQAQRATTSGVSLNEEATKLVQFQQAYQAAGKLVSVLDSLTQTVINMVH